MITVLGLGNVLMGDDAFGPWAVQLLDAGWSFPDDVVLLDAGTPGLDLVPHLLDTDALIVLDTVRADAPAGTLRVYRTDELLRRPPPARVSPHDPGLKDTLLTLRLIGHVIEDVTLIGTVPESTTTGIGLSDVVRDVLPVAVDRAVRELVRLEHEPVHRLFPARPAIWWDHPVTSPGPTTRDLPGTREWQHA